MEVIMKTIHALCVALVIMIPALVRASDPPAAPRFTNATIEQTEQSMVQGIAYNNPYMTATIAFTVRDLKGLYPEHSFTPLIIPLMGALKDEDAPAFARTAAAIALHDLRSARGDYAISQAAIFTSSEKVRNVCSWLRYYRLIEKHPELAAVSSPDLFSHVVPVPLPENTIE